jgi:hypothetical protein
MIHHITPGLIEIDASGQPTSTGPRTIGSIVDLGSDRPPPAQKPSVGMIVDFFDTYSSGTPTPKAGLIVAVQTDECVSLRVFPPLGESFIATSIMKRGPHTQPGVWCWDFPPRV